MDDHVRGELVAQVAVDVVPRNGWMEPEEYSPCEWYTDQEGALGEAERRHCAIDASERPLPRQRRTETESGAL